MLHLQDSIQSRPQPSPCSQTLAWSHTAAHNPILMASNHVIRVNIRITTSSATLEGWKTEVPWVLINFRVGYGLGSLMGQNGSWKISVGWVHRSMVQTRNSKQAYQPLVNNWEIMVTRLFLSHLHISETSVSQTWVKRQTRVSLHIFATMGWAGSDSETKISGGSGHLIYGSVQNVLTPCLCRRETDIIVHTKIIHK